MPSLKRGNTYVSLELVFVYHSILVLKYEEVEFKLSHCSRRFYIMFILKENCMHSLEEGFMLELNMQILSFCFMLSN